MNNIDETLSHYAYAPERMDNLAARVEALRQSSASHMADPAALQTMFNSIDLTTLNATDSAESVKAFVGRVNAFAEAYPELKNVGGICVYSVFAPVLKSELRIEGVHRAVVAGCFPSSQAFADIKAAEVRKSVEAGATEVDVVISVGEFLCRNYQFVYEELVGLREACSGARLKVILETGALPTLGQVWDASIIAMEAGADFIKTSTGKNCGGATPEAAVVMCEAIKAYASRSGRKVGFKPAGGVSTAAEASLYYEIVRDTLGEAWLVNTLFRIGASRLANDLLAQILKTKGAEAPGKFF